MKNYEVPCLLLICFFYYVLCLCIFLSLSLSLSTYFLLTNCQCPQARYNEEGKWSNGWRTPRKGARVFFFFYIRQKFRKHNAGDQPNLDKRIRRNWNNQLEFNNLTEELNIQNQHNAEFSSAHPLTDGR